MSSSLSHSSGRPSTGEGRLLFIDALRGIAAFAVVIYHATEANHISGLLTVMPGWLIGTIKHGDLGVAIFFVISGFVIARSLRGVSLTPVNFGQFMMRRSIRLDPPYWAAIIVVIGFGFLSSIVVPGKVPPDISFGRIISHIFYLQDILGFKSFNGVFWTLCLEIQFYFVFGLVLLLAGRETNTGRFVFVITTAAVLSLLWPLGLVTSGLWPGSFLPLWHSFLLGVSCYWIWEDPRITPFAGLYVGIVAIGSATRSDVFSLASVVTSLILIIVSRFDLMSRLLCWRWLQLLGLISYSLYLFHNPVTGAVFRAGYAITGQNVVSEALWWLVSLIACVLFAAVTWWLVERPSISLARRYFLFARPSSPEVSGASGSEAGKK